MIYNVDIATEYGKFSGLPPVVRTPTRFRPSPSGMDYSVGYFTRVLVIKRNDSSNVTEIDPRSTDLNVSLYDRIPIKWRISGPRDRVEANRVIEDFGVYDSNQSAIGAASTVAGTNLNRVLSNPLDYWRGY